MKSYKLNIVILILLMLLSASFLYLKGKVMVDEFDAAVNKNVELRNRLGNSSGNINYYKNTIPVQEENLCKLVEEYEKAKKDFDPSKLKPYSGYSVTSYTTRQGNRSSTRNYIKYR